MEGKEERWEEEQNRLRPGEIVESSSSSCVRGQPGRAHADLMRRRGVEMTKAEQPGPASEDRSRSRSEGGEEDMPTPRYMTMPLPHAPLHDDAAAPRVRIGLHLGARGRRALALGRARGPARHRRVEVRRRAGVDLLLDLPALCAAFGAYWAP